MRASRFGALIVALAAVFWLSTVPSAGVPQAFAPQTATALTHHSGTVAFRIKVPSKSANTPTGFSRARPHYISVSTLSVAVLTDGKNPVVANVSSGVAYVIVRPAAGTHTFTVTAYDRLGAHGNVLSTGTTAPVAVPATGEVRVALTLEGFVARVVLALDQINSTVGYPATLALHVTAQDADGNTILGGTPFAQPFTLLSSDPRHGTISQTTITQATQGVTIAYDGANVPSISFTATGTGLQATNHVTLVPLTPPVSDQLIVTGYPNAAFAISGANQIITTFGVPPPAPFYAYTEAATDTTANRVYVVAEYYVNTPDRSYIASRLDIFNASGGRKYLRVGFFQPPIFPTSIAIDSVAGTLYASDFYDLDVSLFSTAAGHLSRGRITTGLCGGPGPDLAVDPNTQRLFVSVDGGCGSLTAFSTVPPYVRLGDLATGSHGGVAVDPPAGKLYALEPDDDYQTEYVSVFDTSTLKRVARIGPFTTPAEPSAVAVDSAGHHLFVLFAHSDPTPSASTVQVYDIATAHAYPLLGSFTAQNGYNMTIAPFAPSLGRH